MKNIFEYLEKKVKVICTDGKEVIGTVDSMESSLEEGTNDPAYDCIYVYNGANDIKIFRHEIADIIELE